MSKKRIAPPIDEVKCLPCNGTGKRSYELDGPGSVLRFVECKWCKGTGIIKVEIKR